MRYHQLFVIPFVILLVVFAFGFSVIQEKIRVLNVDIGVLKHVQTVRQDQRERPHEQKSNPF